MLAGGFLSLQLLSSLKAGGKGDGGAEHAYCLQQFAYCK